MAIQFFQENIIFKLKNSLKIKKWIKSIVEIEKQKIIDLNFIFCDDEYLHQINVEYLDHDTYTDIITFDNSEEKGRIESDIFISIERVKENADKLQVTFEQELHRVMIHGVLHLLGYKDKTKTDKQTMRAKEDEALSVLVL
ncbi:MAG: rRNA maturation RNase YbeY [Raineya sp.]|jgi:rRNA maturation RNase YbeY|nr:rRNA maturation RNase YbeY [Raineya sp.]